MLLNIRSSVRFQSNNPSFRGMLTQALSAWVLSDYTSSTLDLNSRDSYRE